MSWPLGNSGVKYTPVGGTVEVTHRLQASFRSPTPGFRDARFSRRSLNNAVLDVRTVRGVPEIEADIRYEDDPWAALAMLREAADGAVLTYYPDFDVPGESYPLRLVGVGDLLELPGDIDMALLARYGGRFRFARVDGGSLLPLTSQGVLFRYNPGASIAGATFSRASTATYRSRTGVGTLPLATAAINVLRSGHWALDPTTGLYVPSTLLEGSRTNLLLRSQEFDNASWTNGNASVSANADTAPDGTATADRIVEDATASTTHGSSQAVTASADATYTLSFFLKAGTRTWAFLQMDSGANTVRAWFNLSTGAVGSATNGGTGSGAVGRIEAWGNGRYRCSLSGAVGGGLTAINGRVRLATADAVTTYNGDGASYISAWGAQFEDSAPFASSYIPTTTAAVTRSADSLAFPYPFPPMEITLYVRLIEGGSAQAHTNGRGIVHIGAADLATDPRLVLRGKSGEAGYSGLWDNGTTLVETTALSAPTVGQLVELRLTFSAAGVVTLYQSINGAAETSASAAGGALPAAWAGQLLYLNSQGTSNSGFSSFLKVRGARGIRSLDQMRAL